MLGRRATMASMPAPMISAERGMVPTSMLSPYSARLAGFFLHVFERGRDEEGALERGQWARVGITSEPSKEILPGVAADERGLAPIGRELVRPRVGQPDATSTAFPRMSSTSCCVGE